MTVPADRAAGVTGRPAGPVDPPPDLTAIGPAAIGSAAIGSAAIDLRLVAVALLCWSGVLAGDRIARWWPRPAGLLDGGGPVLVRVGTGLAVAITAAAVVRGLVSRGPRRSAGFGLTAFAWSAVVVGALGCGLVHGVLDRDGPVSQLAARETTVAAVGTVAAVPAPIPGGVGPPGTVSVRLHLHRLVRLRPAAGASVRDLAVDAVVSVRAPAEWSRLPVGATVATTLRLSPAPAHRGVQAWGSALGSPRVLAPPTGPRRVVNEIRAGLVRSCRHLPGPARGLVPAVVDGDTRLVPAATESDMRASGLLHLAAVSGANVAIVVASVTGLLGLLGAGRVLTLVGALTVLAGFTVLADGAPSVLRAGVTATLGLLGARSHGPAAGLRTLAAAALVLVLTGPQLAVDPGFVLSVCATGAIIASAGRLTEALRTWLPRPVAAAVAVSVSAQLGAQPVLGAVSGQLSLVGPVANLLAAPAVAPVTIFGLVAAALGPLSPGAASVAAWAAYPGAWWLAAVARLCAHLPGAAVGWPGGWSGALVASVLGVAGLVAAPGLLRRRRVALPVVGVLLGLLAGPLVLPP